MLLSLIFQNGQTEIQGTLKFDRRLSRRNSAFFFRLGALNSLSFVLVACCNYSLDLAPFNEFSKFLKFPKMLRKKPSKSTLDQLNLLSLLWCFARFARTYHILVIHFAIFKRFGLGVARNLNESTPRLNSSRPAVDFCPNGTVRGF